MLAQHCYLNNYSEGFGYKKVFYEGIFKTILDLWASEDLGYARQAVRSHFMFFLFLFLSLCTSVV